MPIEYKIDVLKELKAAGYSTTRLRKDRIMGEQTIQKLREGKLVSWLNIERICRILNCNVGDVVTFERRV